LAESDRVGYRNRTDDRQFTSLDASIHRGAPGRRTTCQPGRGFWWSSAGSGFWESLRWRPTSSAIGEFAPC